MWLKHINEVLLLSVLHACWISLNFLWQDLKIHVLLILLFMALVNS